MAERIRIEDGQKRIRVYLGGEPVADSTNVKLVWEKSYYPVYYFPTDDVIAHALAPTGNTERSPSHGTAALFDVETVNRTATEAATTYRRSTYEWTY